MPSPHLPLNRAHRARNRRRTDTFGHHLLCCTSAQTYNRRGAQPHCYKGPGCTSARWPTAECVLHCLDNIAHLMDDEGICRTCSSLPLLCQACGTSLHAQRGAWQPSCNLEECARGTPSRARAAHRLGQGDEGGGAGLGQAVALHDWRAHGRLQELLHVARERGAARAHTQPTRVRAKPQRNLLRLGARKWAS